MDDVFERIGNYEANSSTNIYELLKIESYDFTESKNTTSCQNQRKSCSGTDEGYNIYAKVGFSGN